MADRDEANLKHFSSRAHQPKILAGAPAAAAAANQGNPVNVFLVFDSAFGSASDEIDDNRFRYVGTTPNMSRYERMGNQSSNRHTGMTSMRSGFEY